MRLAVIIVNWNGIAIKYRGKPILKTCLETLFATTKNHKLETIVMDAESQDGSVQYVRRNFKNVTVMAIENEGWEHATNAALRYINKKYPDIKYVLSVSPDIIFKDKTWLDKLLAAADEHNDAGVVGCTLYYPDGKVQHAGLYMSGIGEATPIRTDTLPDRYVYSIMGAMFLVRMDVFKKTGLFDEFFLPGWCEEIDLFKRAERFGYRCYYVQNTNIIHLEGWCVNNKDKTLKRKWAKDYLLYIGIRNNMAYLLRWHKSLLPGNVAMRFAQCFFRTSPSLSLRDSSEIALRLRVVPKALVMALKDYKKTRIETLDGKRIQTL